MEKELEEQITQAVNAAMAPLNEKLDKLLTGTTKKTELPSFEARMSDAVKNYKTSGANLKGKEI